MKILSFKHQKCLISLTDQHLQLKIVDYTQDRLTISQATKELKLTSITC